MPLTKTSFQPTEPPEALAQGLPARHFAPDEGDKPFHGPGHNKHSLTAPQPPADPVGPMAGELAPSIINLMKHGDKYDQPVAAFASVAIGPTPQTRGLGHWLIDRAKDEPPGSELRANLAMVLWACCHQTDDAIEILIPLLDDQGWATTRSAWILGQMGRDGRAALPRLRQLAAGPNPAYANWVGEAVRLIETELRRKIEPAGAYEELADDDYLVSLRALWRMVDMGQPGAKLIKDRLAQDDTPRLPGAKLRQQARARQVLAVLEPAREISAATQVDQ